MGERCFVLYLNNFLLFCLFLAWGLGIGFFSSEQTKGFFSTNVCLNPCVPGHTFTLRQVRSPEEGLYQPGWMNLTSVNRSLTDPFMLILVMVKEVDPGITCYKSPFARILK